ncbi:MAG: hypothetical protein HFE86_00750 [Clostridiales bacterium]|nr:hypothetical protein [Clostridiales bacterium]
MSDSDALLSGYLQSQVDKELYGDVALFGTAAGDRLEEGSLEKKIYVQLREQIAEVAAGKRDSAAFKIDQNSLSELKWTAADLGCPITILPDNTLDFTTLMALSEKFNSDLDTGKIINCLLSDCPYELYWFDKTAGMRSTYNIGGGTDELHITSLTLQFTVSGNYRGSGTYTVDTAKTKAASAAANIADIIRENDGKGDRDKLDAYRAEICDLVSYNWDATTAGFPYGDPWQLIYVFDGDPSTNVVCEGYSKAFQYLCDNSRFDGDVTCHSVSGTMDGGGHMWNVVSWNGKNYLADVTNCDAGTVGAPDRLFLVGTAGTENNRTHTFTIMGTEIVYRYDDEMKNLLCDGFPALSALAALTFADSSRYDIPAATVGAAIREIDLSGGVSGGMTPYIFSAEGLPAGLAISAAGVISGKPSAAGQAGTATITVTDAAGARKSITIAYGAVSPAAVPVTGVTLTPRELELAAGKTQKLSWAVSPAGATVQDVTFTSDHPEIAAVDRETGVVTGVSAGKAIITVETADGGKTAQCAVTVFCDHNNQAETAAKASDCKTQGWSKYYTCEDCGRLLDADGVSPLDAVPYLPLAAHTAQRHDSVAATHETAGSKEYWTCEVCGGFFGDAACTQVVSPESLVIPAVPHSYGDTWEKDSQKHWHVCECGHTADEAAHTFGRWTVTLEATETETGERERSCSVCGHTETQVIPIGGIQEPDIIPGDLDGDGQVTIQDVMEACKVLARQSAGTPPTADELAGGDLNGDQKITISDIMEICKILARKS